MKIVYSFNKQGFEAEVWEKGIRAASDDSVSFIPFNHQHYLNPKLYIDAIKLDRLYQARHPKLMQLYEEFEAAVNRHHADAIIVNHCPPYHPDFLRKLKTYKVLYSGDDPGATYMRNIPYLHAYQHVFYLNPDYSNDLNMREKMRYCGMEHANWVPHGIFDEDYETTKTADTILDQNRDIDIIYVGAPYIQKLELLAKIKKTFGNKCRLHGRFRLPWNIYYNGRYGWPGWIKPVSYAERTRLHQRAKIGFNIHWNEHGLGNQRLYYLPANGVMQICDSQRYLHDVFKIDEEVVGYRGAGELIDKIRYYLEHEQERKEIAVNGFRRVLKEYRFSDILRKSTNYIGQGMQNS
jgi:spore maturation protein CgeB